MKIAFGFILWFFALTATAQTSVDNFTLVNVTDGTSVSLDDFKSMEGVLVIFTSHVCPFDGYYRDRIKGLISTYQGKVQVLLVNAHVEADESEDKMKSASAQWNIPVPYLADKDQVAMKAMGAKKSPEAFLLKSKGGKFTIMYSGAIDDNPQMASAVSQPYVKTAIDRLLAGQTAEISSTRTIGCTIRGK